MKMYAKLFDHYWLPIFLLLSVTWLAAPALQHSHYGNLVAISAYEANGQPWAWFFRACDAIGALLLATAVWRFRIATRDRLLGLALLIIAALSAMDIIFPMGCHDVCTPIELFSWGTHDVESAVLALTVMTSAIVVFWRTRSLLSLGFICSQLLLLMVAESGLLSDGQSPALQVIYELMVIGWAARLVSMFAPVPAISKKVQRRVRRSFMDVTLLAGIFALSSSLVHHRIFDRFIGLQSARLEFPWLTHHSVVAGLVLLYIARQVGKGNRKAAIVLATTLVTFLIVYTLYWPQLFLAALTAIALAILWRYSGSFTRSSSPLPLASRFKDLAVVAAGMLVACCMVLVIAVSTGHDQQLFRAVGHIYSRQVPNITGPVGRRIPERYESQLRRVANTLGAGLVLLLVWTLFRPNRRLLHVMSDGDRERLQYLLDKHSNSSEDYIKIWPQDKHYFFDEDGDGFIAYKIAGSVAFALADPIAAEERRPVLLAAFREFCHNNGWQTCFLLVQASSKHYYTADFKLLRIGSSANIDIAHYADVTVREKWWRWQANRARKAGYHYAALKPPHTPEQLAELRVVSDKWLERDGRAEQSFALGYYDERYLQQCVIHTLCDSNDRVVAFTNELPAFNKSSQRTIDLMRFDPDIDGAMAALLMLTLQAMHHKGIVKTFDLGFVPLAKLDSNLAKIARRLAASRFSAGGLEQFKAKFRPEWQPNYIAYDGDVLDLLVVLSALENVLKVPHR